MSRRPFTSYIRFFWLSTTSTKRASCIVTSSQRTYFWRAKISITSISSSRISDLQPITKLTAKVSHFSAGAHFIWRQRSLGVRIILIESIYGVPELSHISFSAVDHLLAVRRRKRSIAASRPLHCNSMILSGLRFQRTLLTSLRRHSTETKKNVLQHLNFWSTLGSKKLQKPQPTSTQDLRLKC